MSEGALFAYAQRWPPPPVSGGSLPGGGGARAAADGAAAAGGSSRGAAATLGQADAASQLQQPPPHHLQPAHLSRARSEVSARPDPAEHLKKLHAHWSDTGLLRGPHTAQPRWAVRIGPDEDGGDLATQARRNSLDSAQAAATRGRGPPYMARQTEESPLGRSRGSLDTVEYAQRPDAVPVLGQGATIAAGLGRQSVGMQPLLQQQEQQQWNWPALAPAAATAAAYSSRASVSGGPPPPSLMLQQPLAGQLAAVHGGGIADAGALAQDMYRPRSGTDLTVKGFVQLQRGALEKLALEVHRQETCLRSLHGMADQLSCALEQLRARNQASAAAAQAAVAIGLRGVGSSAQSLPSGRAKELVVKLRLDNSHLLADIEDLERELTELRLSYARGLIQEGVNSSSNEGEHRNRSQVSSAQLHRGYSAPAPSECAEQADHGAHTWPVIVSRTSATEMQRGGDALTAPVGNSSSRAVLRVATAAPDEGEAAGWNCDICTFLNHAMLNVCEICEAPRMTGRPAVRTACCHQTGCYCHIGAHGGGHA